MEDLQTTIKEAIEDIDSFYHGSFKLPPQRCLPFFIALIDKLGGIEAFLTEKQKSRLNKFLAVTMEAMEAGDYVLVNDYLVYELRPLLAGLATRHGLH
ncbi:MAG TPA: hypothetical protein VN521_01560 [Negativicutes bacterium]|nr:hypothetical protein [Negativicutes bacterium]